MNKEQLFRKLYKSHQRRIEWIDKLPRDIQQAFFDNDYVNTLLEDNRALMQSVFDEHYASVEWFLCEWKPGAEIGQVGEEPVKIQTIDQYIDWMKSVEGFR